MKRPWALLLTGLPNSGKSTLAYLLVQKCIRNVLIIDGDKHREMQFLGNELGFSDEDILKNNRHVVKLARFAQDQDINVIIAQITPLLKQRWEMKQELKNIIEIYLSCSKEIRSKRDNYVDSSLIYEQGLSDLFINTEMVDEEKSVDCILSLMKMHEYI